MPCPACQREHGGRCHECPHNAQVLAGKWQRSAWNKTPCSGCLNASDAPSNSGQTFVELRDSIRHDPPPQHEDDGRLEPLVNFVHELMRMPSITRDIVCWRILHEREVERHSFSQIGLRLGLSAQDVEMRLKRALVSIPALQVAFAAKIARRARRGG